MKLGFSSCIGSRLQAGLAVLVGTGVLLALPGCGDNNTADAQNPPPQTLSEPVRPMENDPASPPAIPVTSNDPDFASQKAGESRALPQFEAPAPVPPPALAMASAVAPSSQTKYHMLAKGETLYAVARQYNVKPRDLIAANQFKDPNHLSVGTKVLIP